MSENEKGKNPKQSEKQQEPAAEKDLEKAAAEELNGWLAERKVKLVPNLQFPIYNKLPVELQLALAVIERHEPQFDVEVVTAERAAENGAGG